MPKQTFIPMTRALLALFFTASLAACGGGSSSDASDQLGIGGMTILVGDGPLDNVEEVNIDIGRMVLIGDDGQIVLTDDATEFPINLLDLRNVTKLLVDVEAVPTGNYTKIRTYIESLEIVGDDVNGGRFSDFAQLPANGKIDLLARGGFEISPGEDLVVQIDFDLEHSVHIVETGNSEYRFRPVVFIEVQDLRLTRLFGTAEQVADDDGNFVLCEEDAPDTPCVSVNATDALTFPEPGLDQYDLMDGDQVHVFGLFNVGALTDASTVFDAVAVIQGAQNTVARIDGEVMLDGEGNIASIGDRSITPIEGHLILDRQGNPIEPADGDHAESWAQVDPLTTDLTDPFHSFLTLVTPATDEEDVEGTLVGIDGSTLLLAMDDFSEVCVVVDDGTEIQNVDGFDTDASTGDMALTDLLSLDPEMETIEIAAFGTFQEGATSACLEADIIVVETESD